MALTSRVPVEPDVLDALHELKENRHETLNSVIKRLIETYSSALAEGTSR